MILGTIYHKLPHGQSHFIEEYHSTSLLHVFLVLPEWKPVRRKLRSASSPDIPSTTLWLRHSGPTELW